MPQVMTLLSLVAFLAPATALGTECLVGNKKFSAGLYTEAIEIHEVALNDPTCARYKERIELELAAAYHKRAEGSGAAHDHCRAADLYGTLAQTGSAGARKKAAVRASAAPALCQAARLLEERDPIGAISVLQTFVDRHRGSGNEEMQAEVQKARNRIAEVQRRRFGWLAITCTEEGMLTLRGRDERRPCPAEWAGLPEGRYAITLKLGDERLVNVELDVVGGHTTRHHIIVPPSQRGGTETAPGPGTSDQQKPPPEPNIAAATTTIGAGALAIGGGVLLYLGAAADADREATEQEWQNTGSDDAARRFDDHADRANFYGVAGWSALGLATGLGAVATWLWLDPAALDRDGRVTPGEPTPSGEAMGWLLTGGGAAFLVGGGVLLALASEQDTRREAAERDWLAAADGAPRDASSRRFEAAADRADLYGAAGWAALGVGAALGATAAWWWWGTPNATVSVGPGGVGVSGRY